MPKLTEVRVSYSIGIKANIGNYESADAHLSETETWDVSDLDEMDVEFLVEERRQLLREKLGKAVEAEYAEFHGTASE